MKCLGKLDQILYPKDLVYSLTRLYTFRGKDFYYEDVFKQHMSGIIKNTIRKDTICAAKLLKLNVTDARLRLIAKNDSEPKTKDEIVVANLKKVFTTIQEFGSDFELSSNEILKLAELTFKGATKIGYGFDTIETHETLLTEEKRISRRNQMDDELNLYIYALETMHIEPTNVAVSFYVDMLNSNFFTSFNDYIALITLYCLLFREEFHVFKYVSFFEKILNNLEDFELAKTSANYRWKDGYSDTSKLNRFIIDIMLKGYEYIENEVQSHEFDKNLKKVDSVEAAIMKMDKVFTKEQVKAQCPSLSDSTINRALKNLKDEKKIAPTGTGRSAAWMKLVEDEIYVKGTKQQLSLFDMQEMNGGF